MLNIFEYPWGLLIVAVIVSLILVVLRRLLQSKHLWRFWLLPAFLVLAAFGIDALVQTDREKITSVINTAVKAVEQEKPDVIDKIIAPDYSDSYHTKKNRLMGRCKSWLSEPLVEKNIKKILDMKITPPTADVTFTVRTIFDQDSIISETYKREIFFKLKVRLKKQPDNSWLINRAEILEIDHIPATWENITNPF